jgi:hypothetical protein
MGFFSRAQPRYRRGALVRWERVDGGAVILDAIEGELVRFNGVGDRIWQSLDGAMTAADLGRLLSEEYDAAAATLAKDAAAFLARLEKMELVERA